MTQDPVLEAKSIALRYLTGAPRTRQQIEDKLREKEVDGDIIANLVERFERVGLIDDADYAHRFVENRSRMKGLGKAALRRDLKAKGVDDALIEEALAEIEPADEAELAREMVSRKLPRPEQLQDFEGREKAKRRLVSMLMRKGHSMGTAIGVVEEKLQEALAE